LIITASREKIYPFRLISTLRSPHIFFSECLGNASGLKRHFGIAVTEWLEMIHFRLCRNIYVPSRALVTMLDDRPGRQKMGLVPTPFYLEME